MSKKEQILEGALEQFLQNGIKSVTMDDVSRTLGISKKTLYLYVTDKSDLVKKAMMQHMESDKAFAKKNFNGKLNAIDELIAMSEFICNKMKERNPSIMFDLQKYYPETWKMFVEHKQGHIYNMIYQNLLKGIKQKYYTDDFNPVVIAKIYISRLEACMDTNVFPSDEFYFKDIIMEVMRYHIRGVSSAKGMQYLNKKKKITS
ncbi:MAG: TetR/AcrR family transcriptional regulator [Bacteroidetes bacterium]|nr:TetR/AcrR family transcriptional regulator [Bacteroidota bacterium]